MGWKAAGRSQAEAAGNAMSPTDRLRSPKGIAFEVEDLDRLMAWSQAHGLRMVVELDVEVEGDEYEEVLAFYEPGILSLRRWLMWRSRDYFAIQSMNRGPCRRALCVSHLMEELTPLGP